MQIQISCPTTFLALGLRQEWGFLNLLTWSCVYVATMVLMLWKTLSQSGQEQSDEIVQQFRERFVYRRRHSGFVPQSRSLVFLTPGLKLNFTGGAHIAAVSEKVRNCFSTHVARSSVHAVTVLGIWKHSWSSRQVETFVEQYPEGRTSRLLSSAMGELDEDPPHGYICPRALGCSDTSGTRVQVFS